jgi:hypothetical protein
MKSERLDRTARREDGARDDRQSPTSGRYTISWGWFTAPRFGAAGSGGLEYEPLPERKRDAA